MYIECILKCIIMAFTKGVSYKYHIATSNENIHKWSVLSPAQRLKLDDGDKYFSIECLL